MNKNILLSTILCSLCLTPFAVSANDKVETTYNAQTYQRVCKGKMQGAPVDFAYRGIIWNGTCEPLFFPTSKSTSIQGDADELYAACSTNSNARTTVVNGREIRGKCALGFTAIRPH